MHRPTPLRTAAACLVLLIGGRAVATADDAAATPGIDPKADAILQAMSKHYRAADAGAGKVDVKIRVDQAGEEMKIDLASEFAFKRPNLIAVRSTSEMEGAAIVCDGKHLFLHAAMLGKYIELDAPATIADLVDHLAEIASVNPSGGAELDVLIGLLGEDPHAKLTESISALKYIGEETLDETKVHRLRMTEEQVDLDLWIDAGDQPWLYRVRPDLEAFFRNMYGEEAAGQAPELIVAFHDWSRAAPADDAFAFSPPEGAEKVATFFDPADFGGMGDDEAMALVGTEAPAVELELLEGGTVNLAEHRGKNIVILDFWATWCKPCISAIPTMIEVAEAYADRGVVFFGVNVGETDEKVRAMMESKEWSFNVAMDRSGAVSTLYKAMAIPQTVIIGKDGTVQAVHVGALPNLKEQLTGELDTLLSGKSLAGESHEGESEGGK